MKKVLILLLIGVAFNVGILWNSWNSYVEALEDKLEQSNRETVVVHLPVEVEVEVPVVTNKYISLQRNLTELDLPNVSGEFKTFMDYRTITSTGSKQYHFQQLAQTDEQGFRKFNGKYMVAVGTFYADQVGKELLVTFDTGKTIHTVVADIKQDIHTDENNQYIPFNGNIVEFIVDIKVMGELPLKLGNVSILGLEGEIVSIREVEYSE